jgi:hypothetical protein
MQLIGCVRDFYNGSLLEDRNLGNKKEMKIIK